MGQPIALQSTKTPALRNESWRAQADFKVGMAPAGIDLVFGVLFVAAFVKTPTNKVLIKE